MRVELDLSMSERYLHPCVLMDVDGIRLSEKDKHGRILKHESNIHDNPIDVRVELNLSDSHINLIPSSSMPR